MQTLTAIIMRHAQAAEPRPPAPDFERPLTASGRAEAAAVGAWLRRGQPRPAKVLCSPARRTRMTAEEIFAGWTEPAPPIEWEPALYLAEVPTLLEILNSALTTPILLLGHNPGLEDLVAYLLPREGGAPTRPAGMPTAGVCVIDIGIEPHGVRPGAGVLRVRTSPAELARGAPRG